MKPYLLRFHRWLTLLFAMPWIVILVTGLILSFEPIAMDRAFTGRSISPAAVEQALATHDPDRKASTLNIRAYDNAIILSQGRTPLARVDATTGQKIEPARGLWADVFTTSRRLHESLMLDMKWLVDASTIAMLVSILFGLFMGLPVLRNTLGGWHRMVAWGTLPLLILSPLTGLAIAYGITFTGPMARPEGPPPTLAEAVRIIGATHDMASVYWIRPMGGALRARIYDGRVAKVFTVTKSGLVTGAQSWPRAIHEGNWAGVWSGLVNVLTSLALIGLMFTGLWIWARRSLRLRANRRARAATAA
ncbi:MAG TPA: PepSY-associated TM helix domain-containing protein [Hyphomicrobiaceae bacterium]|nr:PepSY-associated TM helix domain-containing protein [Hyphomicrobiaceae bacterium]